MATSIMSAAKVTVAPATHDPAAAPAPILFPGFNQHWLVVEPPTIGW